MSDSSTSAFEYNPDKSRINAEEQVIDFEDAQALCMDAVRLEVTCPRLGGPAPAPLDRDRRRYRAVRKLH
jgi:hypothetical protein